MDLDNVNTTNTDSDIDMENIQMDNNGSSRKRKNVGNSAPNKAKKKLKSTTELLEDREKAKAVTTIIDNLVGKQLVKGGHVCISDKNNKSLLYSLYNHFNKLGIYTFTFKQFVLEFQQKMRNKNMIIKVVRSRFNVQNMDRHRNSYIEGWSLKSFDRVRLNSIADQLRSVNINNNKFVNAIKVENEYIEEFQSHNVTQEKKKSSSSRNKTTNNNDSSSTGMMMTNNTTTGNSGRSGAEILQERLLTLKIAAQERKNLAQEVARMQNQKNIVNLINDFKKQCKNDLSSTDLRRLDRILDNIEKRSDSIGAKALCDLYDFYIKNGPSVDAKQNDYKALEAMKVYVSSAPPPGSWGK